MIAHTSGALSINTLSFDNCPALTAKAERRWFNNLRVNLLFFERRNPSENDHIESFNGKSRDELLNREVFTTLAKAEILIVE